ncbi:MAG: hypothetical protein JETCAE01_33320 [Anaerolineaceae bacterium]|nr:MAG: hypothetical protein JETCAE01_33320 [Anaerolineaceae bacterium]
MDKRGMVCWAGPICGGGEQWDEPRDDIAKWDDVDEQKNFWRASV